MNSIAKELRCHKIKGEVANIFFIKGDVYNYGIRFLVNVIRPPFINFTDR